MLGEATALLSDPDGAILELLQVSRRFGALVVADRIDLALQPGETLGIIGPNGAGKSTLFGLISGELQPDSGQILLAGRDIVGLPAFVRCRLGIARARQIPRPFAAMTVFENLLVGACFGDGRNGDAAEDRCLRLLRATGLLRRADHPAGALTLLERKRLELARALATGPRVLLLDEVAGGLTEREFTELAESIQAVREPGLAIVWVEHVLHALRSWITRLLVLDFGAKVADGDPERVIADPRVRELYLGPDTGELLHA